jgi:DNA repair protein RadA/Sms
MAPETMNRCDNCGAFEPVRLESCPVCGGFATLLPFEPPASELAPAPPGLSQDSSEIEQTGARAISTGFEPWDEALGGGLVVGSSLVVYGGPGSRKSTWMGAIADQVASRRRGVALFLSAEMTAPQALEAVLRVHTPRGLRIIALERNAPDLNQDVAEIRRIAPRVVLYDSIQAFDAGGAMAGSDFAVTATVKMGRRLAATMGHVAIFISQVNKAGLPAGPYRTIHDCDVVARMEIGKVTVTKNRFAPARVAVLPE